MPETDTDTLLDILSRLVAQRQGPGAGPLSKLMTTKEYAGVRGCSTRQAERDRAEGRGCPYVRIDGRVFYRPADVERFIEAHVRGGFRGHCTDPTTRKVAP